MAEMGRRGHSSHSLSGGGALLIECPMLLTTPEGGREGGREGREEKEKMMKGKEEMEEKI